MGTNFYQMRESPHLDLEFDEGHIGKRSAAGWYCYDCNRTLCEQGNEAIHSGRGTMLERCPKCGADKQRRGHNGAMVEVGFSPPANARPTGVQGCSSFSWAQQPEAVGLYCKDHLADACVKDEYGREMAGQEFLDMLANNCPVQFEAGIGQAVSSNRAGSVLAFCGDRARTRLACFEGRGKVVVL